MNYIKYFAICFFIGFSQNTLSRIVDSWAHVQTIKKEFGISRNKVALSLWRSAQLNVSESTLSNTLLSGNVEDFFLNNGPFIHDQLPSGIGMESSFKISTFNGLEDIEEEIIAGELTFTIVYDTGRVPLDDIINFTMTDIVISGVSQTLGNVRMTSDLLLGSYDLSSATGGIHDPFIGFDVGAWELNFSAPDAGIFSTITFDAGDTSTHLDFDIPEPNILFLFGFGFLIIYRCIVYSQGQVAIYP